MTHDLVLVKLNPSQIAQAKAANGERKRITHALLCGPHGQIFGTEKQCRKYFSAWDPACKTEVSPGKFQATFPNLFRKAIEVERCPINAFESTFNLVNILMEAQDRA